MKNKKIIKRIGITLGVLFLFGTGVALGSALDTWEGIGGKQHADSIGLHLDRLDELLNKKDLDVKEANRITEEIRVQLNQKNTELNQKNTEISNKQNEINEKIAEINKKIAEINTLNDRINSINSENDNLKSANAKLTTDKASLELEISNLKKQIEKLNEDYESNSNWKEKHDELLKELKKAEKQVEGLDAKGQAIYDKHK